MDEDISEKTEKTSILPVLGLLGLGVGIVAMALGVVALVKVGDASAELGEKIEKANALALETKSISDRIDALAIQVENLKAGDNGKVENLARQVQSALNKVQEGMNKLSAEISENRSAIEQVASRPARRAPEPSATAPAQTDSEQGAETSNAASGGTYKIQAGDTFGKLARKFNVSVSSLMNANPGVNPSRLKINQEIVIPR